MKLSSIVVVLAGTAIASPIAAPQRYGDRLGPGLIDTLADGIGSAVGGVFGGLLDTADALTGSAIDLIGDLLTIPGDLLDAIGLKRAWTEQDTEEIKEMRAVLAPIIEKYHQS